MAVLHFDALAGKLTAALPAADTSMSSAGLAALGTVAGPDIVQVTLYRVDSLGRFTWELVHITAHTAAATTATVLRNQGGTNQTWPAGTKWTHAFTVADYNALVAATAAEAALARNADNLTSGTIPDARIPAAIARDSEVATAVSDHAAAGDPHPGYLTPAEGNATYVRGVTRLTVDDDAPGSPEIGDLWVDTDTALTDLFVATAAGAPMTAGAANGVATLDGSGDLTATQVPAALTADIDGKLDAADNLSDVASVATARTNLGLAAAVTQQVDVFLASGTWNKPAGAISIRALVIGGGGAGGPGRRGAVSTIRAGGGGGGGGGWSTVELNAADVTTPVTVTVGVGGTGGVAQTVDDSNGVQGSSGGTSSFGSYVAAAGGTRGSGGTATNGSGGAGGAGMFAGATGGTCTSGGAGAQSAAASAPGGGAGGGATAANAENIGGDGRVSSARNFLTIAAPAGGTIPGGNGASAPAADIPSSGVPGVSGAGGAASITTAGGTGGNGTFGCGGGGGGGSLNGFNSGAGGNGGPGLVVVITTRTI